MSVLRSNATVGLEPDGAAEVAVTARLNDRSRIYCHLYEGSAPIMSVVDEHVRISVTVPDPDQVSKDDVAWGHRLADAVARYVAELEKLAAMNLPAPADGDKPTGQAA